MPQAGNYVGKRGDRPPAKPPAEAMRAADAEMTLRGAGSHVTS